MYRTELATVQEQYVTLAVDKDTLLTELTALRKQLDNDSVTKSIERLSNSGSDDVTSPSSSSSVRNAVRLARIDWLKEQEM